MSELRFNQAKQFVCIDYPGRVKHVDKMIETLGGIDNINKVYNDPNRRLELRYRPDNPFCYGVRGDREKSCSVLMKVKRKKKKDQNEPDSGLNAEILGIIPTTFRFKGLMDFQYLPMKKKEDGNFHSILPEIVPESIDTDISWLNGDAPLLVLPPLFSRIEIPQNYHFRRPPQPKSGDKTTAVPPNIISKTRKFRGRNIRCVSFDDDEIPMEPDPDIAAKVSSRHFLELYDTMKEAFEERPIWSKNALLVKYQCDRFKMKILLPALAYYALGGPWRGLWIRFGYDPKSQFEAKQYQLLDFRVKQSYGSFNLNTNFKRVSLENSLPNNKSKRKPQYSINMPHSSTSTDDGSSQYVYENPFGIKCPNVEPELVYKFKPNHFPPFRQMFYQLCDIESPVIQKMISDDQPEESGVCNMKHGWLSSELLVKCRAEMTKIIQDLIRSKGELPDDKSTATSDNESGDEIENPYPDNMENEMDMDLIDYMES